MSWLLCCLTSTEAGWPIRDGDRVGKGTGWLARPRKPPEKDRRDRRPPPEQWKCYGGVPSPLPSDLCTAQLLFQLLCWTESLRQCPLHRCWRTTWTTRSKRRPTCSAQLHLPTHDLFWAKVRVQLHLPPLRSLDLLISPGTLSWWKSVCFILGDGTNCACLCGTSWGQCDATCVCLCTCLRFFVG